MPLGIPSELAFSKQEYDRRLERTLAKMQDYRVDVLLVHTPRNQCYLTGFETLNMWQYSCLILSMGEPPILLVPEMEEAGVYLTSWIKDTVLFRPDEDPVALTAKVLQEKGLDNAHIGLEMQSISITPAQYLQLQEALPRATFVETSELVRGLGMIKSPAEIDYIRQAARITDQGIQAAIQEVAAGKTDQDLAAVAYESMIRAGSEYMCIQPIVTTGRRSGVPHSTHKRVLIAHGDPVFLEFGACIHRYSGPIMRTVVVGQASDAIKRTAEASITALNYAIEAMKPGVTGDEVAHAAWKGVQKDRPEIFYHGVVGYSIGLSFPPNWGDVPFFVLKGQQQRLEPGMVFHLPIAFRDIGTYCVGFSETVVITETGCEVMGSSPRELIVV